MTSINEVRPEKWFFDYGSDRIYLAENPSGKTIELSVTPYAFQGTGVNVTIANLIVEKYATPVVAAGTIRTNDNWVIQDSEIRFNHARNIEMLGSNVKVLRNKVHTNGQIGINGGGSGGLVEGNEISHNNFAGYAVDWEAGGTKFHHSSNVVLRNNAIHHNNGIGLWVDIQNKNIRYENNHIYANKGMGLFHELNFNGAIIRNNVVEQNGFGYKSGSVPWSGAAVNVESIYYGGGIVIAESPDVEVYGNTVRNNKHGIVVMDDPRGYKTQNLKVHDNTIIQSQGVAAGMANWGSNPTVSSSNNRFYSNTYHLPNLSGSFFEWTGLKTRSEWQKTGNDINSDWHQGVKNFTPAPAPKPTPASKPAPKPAPAPAPAGKGLVAHWSFDESSGRAVDSSRNNNQAALQNGATRAPGKLGKALKLDGNNDFAAAPHHPSLNLTNGITIGVWVKAEAPF